MAVPNIFASATAAIPLSQLDTNFATAITLGNVAMQLGNTITTINNLTLGNATLTGASITLASTAAPAFSAYLLSNTTITASSVTKVTFDTENFDTNSNFATSRFTPTVAGYYQVNARIGTTASTTPTRVLGYIYKNGSAYHNLGDMNYAGAYSSNGGAIITMNGSTDFLEIYVFLAAGVAVIDGGNALTYFNGAMIRSA